MAARRFWSWGPLLAGLAANSFASASDDDGLHPKPQVESANLSPSKPAMPASRIERESTVDRAHPGTISSPGTSSSPPNSALGVSPPRTRKLSDRGVWFVDETDGADYEEALVAEGVEIETAIVRGLPVRVIMPDTEEPKIAARERSPRPTGVQVRLTEWAKLLTQIRSEGTGPEETVRR